MKRSLTALLALAVAGCSTGGAPSGADPVSTGGTGTGASGGSSGASGAAPAGGSSGLGTGGTSGGTGGSTPTGGSGGSVGATGGSGAMPGQPHMGVGVAVLAQCVDPSVTSVGPTPIRRLSRLEYHNAVRDLFGVEVNQGDLPSDEPLGTFTANVRNRMTADQFTRFDTAGKQVAEQVATNFVAFSGCGATDAACNKAFLAQKARLAFHGQALGDADQTRLFALYDSIAVSNPALAASTALRFILNSPRFLYALDFGTADGGVSRLSGSEIAGRLASFLWRSVPDATLLAAADAGMLDTPAGRRTEATRMLADAKADPVLQKFAAEWLGLTPSPPGGSALDAAIDTEPGEVLTALAKGTGTYPDLLLSTTSRGPAELAQFYGGTASGNGSISLPAERAGLLMRAAFGRSHVKGSDASPTQRGMQVREALLCERVELPKDNVNMMLPDKEPGQTTNDVVNKHASSPECAGCHQMIDPIGYGFATLSATGSYDAALASTTAGYIATDSGQIDFANTAELLNVLATDPTPRQCFAIQTARFALGRGETTADACALKGVWDAFVAGDLGLQTLLIELAASPLIQYRNVVNPGMACQ